MGEEVEEAKEAKEGVEGEMEKVGVGREEVVEAKEGAKVINVGEENTGRACGRVEDTESKAETGTARRGDGGGARVVRHTSRAVG